MTTTELNASATAISSVLDVSSQQNKDSYQSSPRSTVQDDAHGETTTTTTTTNITITTNATTTTDQYLVTETPTTTSPADDGDATTTLIVNSREDDINVEHSDSDDDDNNDDFDDYDNNDSDNNYYYQYTSPDPSLMPRVALVEAHVDNDAFNWYRYPPANCPRPICNCTALLVERYESCVCMVS